jgi:hypothetical protein
MREIVLISHLGLITIDFGYDIGLETERGKLCVRTLHLAS